MKHQIVFIQFILDLFHKSLKPPLAEYIPHPPSQRGTIGGYERGLLFLSKL